MSNEIQRLHFDFVEVAGEVIEDVTVLNPAIVAYDLARAKFNWPKRDDAEMLFGTYVIWSQLHADGRYPGEFKDFRDRDCTAAGDWPTSLCSSCGTPAASDESLYCHKCGDELPAEDEPREPETVNPTRAGAVENSASLSASEPG